MRRQPPARKRLAVLPRNAPSLLDMTSVAPGPGTMLLYDWAYLSIPWLPCLAWTYLTRRYRSPWPDGMTPWRARRLWRCLDAHLRRSIRVRNRSPAHTLSAHSLARVGSRRLRYWPHRQHGWPANALPGHGSLGRVGLPLASWRQQPRGCGRSRHQRRRRPDGRSAGSLPRGYVRDLLPTRQRPW